MTAASEPTPLDPRMGAVLDGRYRVVALLADGAMGTVYRGERLQLGRGVAIKFLRRDLSRNSQIVRRFEVEVRAMSRLQHPNCVSVIDFGTSPEPYFVMELVDGVTLRGMLDPPLPATRALRIARQTLAAL